MITPQLLSSYDQEISNINADIQSVVKRETNTLILNMSTNMGKIDESGKKLLNSLLEVAPDDYWLNVIKNKQHK